MQFSDPSMALFSVANTFSCSFTAFATYCFSKFDTPFEGYVWPALFFVGPGAPSSKGNASLSSNLGSFASGLTGIIDSSKVKFAFLDQFHVVDRGTVNPVRLNMKHLPFETVLDAGVLYWDRFRNCPAVGMSYHDIFFWGVAAIGRHQWNYAPTGTSYGAAPLHKPPQDISYDLGEVHIEKCGKKLTWDQLEHSTMAINNDCVSSL